MEWGLYGTWYSLLGLQWGLLLWYLVMGGETVTMVLGDGRGLLPWYLVMGGETVTTVLGDGWGRLLP